MGNLGELVWNVIFLLVGIGGIKRVDLQLRAEYYKQQGEGYRSCQVKVQVQQDGGYKGYQLDELKIEGQWLVGFRGVVGVEGFNFIFGILGFLLDLFDLFFRGSICL